MKISIRRLISTIELENSAAPVMLLNLAPIAMTANSSISGIVVGSKVGWWIKLTGYAVISTFPITELTISLLTGRKLMKKRSMQ